MWSQRLLSHRVRLESHPVRTQPAAKKSRLSRYLRHADTVYLKRTILRDNSHKLYDLLFLSVFDAKLFLQQCVHRLRVRLAARRLHHLPDEPADGLWVGFGVVDLVRVS